MTLIPAAFLASDLSEPDFRAITTSKQVMALGLYTDSLLRDKEPWEQYVTSIKKRDVNLIDQKRTKDLLVNAWNTERLLHITREQFSGNRDGAVAQWAFPQAYYAAFNATLAFFVCAGHPEQAHTSVRKKISSLASLSKLAPGFNVSADGGKSRVSVEGLQSSCTDFNSSSLEVSDPENISRHVISNLKNSREIFLKEYIEKNPIKNAKSEPKKRLSAVEWESVSEKIGKTSWLCLLYRKRIKSNYRDIDTFLSEDLDLKGILNGLCSFINAYCLMCEVHVVKHFGLTVYNDWGGKLNASQEDRFQKLKAII